MAPVMIDRWTFLEACGQLVSGHRDPVIDKESFESLSELDCRLPEWPLDTEGEKAALLTGIGEILRSLGNVTEDRFSDYSKSGYLSNIPASSLPCLLSLEIAWDCSHRESLDCLRQLILIDLTVRWDGTEPSDWIAEVASAIPASLDSLSIKGLMLKMKDVNDLVSGLNARSDVHLSECTFQTYCPSVFEYWARNLPRSVHTFRERAFWNDAEEHFCSLLDSPRVANISRLEFQRFQEFSIQTLLKLSRSSLLGLNALSIRTFSDAEVARNLVGSSWWKNLTDLTLFGATSGEVTGLLVDGCASAVQKLSVIGLPRSHQAGNPPYHAERPQFSASHFPHLQTLKLENFILDQGLLAQFEDCSLEEVSFEGSEIDSLLSLHEFLAAPRRAGLKCLNLSSLKYPLVERETPILGGACIASLETLNCQFAGWGLSDLHHLARTAPAGMRQLSLSVSWNDDVEAEDVFSEFFASHLFSGLRSLSIDSLNSVELLVRALEGMGQSEFSLRHLQIWAKSITWQQFLRLSQTRAASQLVDLKLRASYWTEVPESTPIPKVDFDKAWPRLAILEFDYISGLGLDEMKQLSQSRLASHLLRAPFQNNEEMTLWRTSPHANGLLRGVLESYQRKNDAPEDF